MRQALWAGCALLLGALLASALLQEPRADRDPQDDPRFASAAVGAAGGPASVGGAPRWELGDAWRVQFDEGEPVCWLVVVSADDEGYRQGVWCPTEEAPFIAAQIAAYELPYIGRFTAELEGRGAEGDFRFYDWPLTHGKNWQTTWEDEDVLVTAARSGSGGRFALEAVFEESGEPLFTYDYDPELRWWSALSFAAGYEFLVHEREERWEEDATFGVASDRYEARRELSPLGRPADIFEATTEDDVLALMMTWEGTVAGYVEVRDPSGNTQFQRAMTRDSGAAFQLMQGEPGLWSVIDGMTGLVDAQIRIRGIAIETLAFE